MPPRMQQNAKSKEVRDVELDTGGGLNVRPTNYPTFSIGIANEKGGRKTMEDAHSFVADFDNIRGQGSFAVFDGHAGKQAAEWCGDNYHQYLLNALHHMPDQPIPDVLNQTFHDVDEQLTKLTDESEGKNHSGCTAVTAFLRLEDAEGKQSFLEHCPSQPQSPSPPVPDTDSPPSTRSEGELDDASLHDSGSESPTITVSSEDLGPSPKVAKKKKKGSASRIRSALKSIGGGASKAIKSSPAISRKASFEKPKPARLPPPDVRRVLYSANVGDARGVLCRGERAVRLTYDHKGSDRMEAQRIMDAGGFVMSGRVNGVLAVTRSLGDSSMKDFVVGAPYTTETELSEEDQFLIMACDGLWDVVSDQLAVDLVLGKVAEEGDQKPRSDPIDAQEAAEKLVKYALRNHTLDNITVVVIVFKKPAAPPVPASA
ncbi:protein phosphatase 2C [Schizophyllum commune H4-8]|uniref:protein phosphatase 2C n=1 Tax=Schizophyllum commune (strain H4-8 / FGSC 9210) TaxID=578458 RepID=UPI00215E5944|nr:protein phosphatase 2C [Schizophyllum commune H4-8]KAI5889693.1 protein phosphatase 2C [Schizophyllum commune H4-8]